MGRRGGAGWGLGGGRTATAGLKSSMLETTIQIPALWVLLNVFNADLSAMRYWQEPRPTTPVVGGRKDVVNQCLEFSADLLLLLLLRMSLCVDTDPTDY